MERNLSVMLGVVPVLIGAFLPLRELVPRIVLAVLCFSGGIFALFESVYLASQTAAFGSVRIVRWLRVFRAIAIALMGCSVTVALA
jgi:hypothetical protein